MGEDALRLHRGLKLNLHVRLRLKIDPTAWPVHLSFCQSMALWQARQKCQSLTSISRVRGVLEAEEQVRNMIAKISSIVSNC